MLRGDHCDYSALAKKTNNSAGVEELKPFGQNAAFLLLKLVNSNSVHF
jgi:hypothetical protein